jgi:GNAT superfamily N-acetyltransferase
VTASSALTIRPLVPSDRADWQPLWTAYLAFYKTAVPAEVYDVTFARLTSGTDGMHGLVTHFEGQMVGLVHYLFHATCWKVEPVCYLQDLFTLPLARGQGVARALIAAVYEKADAAGAPAVYWNTAENNYFGRMLYDQVGARTPFIRYARPL